MKTIIISDIKSSSESIIPFGLKIGKHTETEVDIVHYIDTRSVQGIQSQYADSHTIAPGEKLTHDAILQKEKDKTEKELDILLSAEGSRLNYPLKINTVVQISNLDEGLQKLVEEYPDALLVIVSEPDGTIFEGINTLLSYIKNIDSTVILVPPGYEFQVPENITLTADFAYEQTAELNQLFLWISAFRSSVDFIGIAKKDDLDDLDHRMNEWRQKLDNFSNTPGLMKINIVSGDDYFETLKEQAENSNSDWFAIPRQHKWDPGLKLFHKGGYKNVIKSANKPVIIY
jgi:hypothetical protein